VGAPEVLASPRGEGGLLVPVVMRLMVPSFIAPSDAPGPTLPELDAPPVGWVYARPGVASAKMQAEANRIFFIWSPWGRTNEGIERARKQGKKFGRPERRSEAGHRRSFRR
jgi:hypothetical protein